MPRKGPEIIVECLTCYKEKSIPMWRYRNNKSKRFYCCVPCKLKGTERKVKTNCALESCGKEIEIHKSQFERTEKNYCCPEHKQLDQNKSIIKKCDSCGGDVVVRPFEEKWENHFCNATCQAKFFDKREIVKCAECGKDIKRSLSLIKVSNRHFCNFTCYGKSKEGEKCLFWNGGNSFRDYDFEFNERLKEFIRERDGRTCQLCGLTEEENEEALACHHIDYIKTNSVESNLIALGQRCGCHSKTNFNREYWTQYFQDLMKEKYQNEYGGIKYGC